MTEAKKILLVVPPTGRFIRESRCQTPIKDLKTVTLRPPIDLLYCAAGFEQGEARWIVEEYWGNPPSTGTLGLVTPPGFEKDDETAWAIIVSYDDEGHVEDDDAASIDYDEML